MGAFWKLFSLGFGKMTCLGEGKGLSGGTGVGKNYTD